jgi:PilZ domain-containing protein
MSVVDQRTYPRIKPPTSVLVAWRSGIQRDVSHVDSLALGGLFFRTKKKVAIRGLVQILLDMPVGQVRGRGVVRWHQDHYGIAVQFIAMEPEDRGRLVRQLRDLTVTAG